MVGDLRPRHPELWTRFSVTGDHDTASALIMAVVGAAAFFGSILGHELAHALEARHRGLEVAAITLFLFGGVSETRSEAESPKDEFALSAVGPYTSFALAAAFGLVATGAGQAGLRPVAVSPASSAGSTSPSVSSTSSPAHRSTGDGCCGLRCGGSPATGAGRCGWPRCRGAIGGLILGLGLFQLFFAPGALVGGLWFAFIGWFLMQAAMAERLQAGVMGLLEGVPVRRLLPEDSPHVWGGTNGGGRRRGISADRGRASRGS